MRRLYVGLLVVATTVLVPILALADNQQVAEQVAATLQRSGQLESYKIGVKYQDGTAWLKGRVSSLDQMNKALTLTFQTPGVTRVVNDLTISSGSSGDEAAEPRATQVQQTAVAATPERRPRLALPSLSGLSRRTEVTHRSAGPKVSRPVGRADRLSATFVSTPAMEAAASAPQTPTPTPTPQAFQPVPATYVQNNAPLPIGQAAGGPAPQYVMPLGGGVAPVQYDQPHVPNYAWPTYAAHPNYAALTYPKQYSPTAWPYIGPFYPYPQVPLGWRKVMLEWHDGWWQLDFDDGPRRAGLISGLFRPSR